MDEADEAVQAAIKKYSLNDKSLFQRCEPDFTLTKEQSEKTCETGITMQTCLKNYFITGRLGDRLICEKC